VATLDGLRSYFVSFSSKKTFVCGQKEFSDISVVFDASASALKQAITHAQSLVLAGRIFYAQPGFVG